LITDPIRQLTDALAQVLEEATALGTDWDEAARRIMAVPARPEAIHPSLLD
jgi:hypothetical protein